MKNRPVAVLADMLGFARQAQDFLSDMDLEEFRADAKTQFAIMHALQFLGEAAKAVPQEDRDRFSAIPWPRIIGMRNIVAHNYLGADASVIYDTVKVSLPPLVAALAQALAP